VRRLRAIGLEVLGGSPEDATRFVKREAATVARFVQEGKLRPD
jgi:hypothetical protein